MDAKGSYGFSNWKRNALLIKGDVAVIPGNVEHEGFFPEDTEVVDVFSPPREDFLTGQPPSYMAVQN